MNILLIISFSLFSFQVAQAQYAEKDFIVYTIKNGLSENEVSCIQQDDWGYMWIGTKVGLNRFDGSNFTNYFQDGAPVNLPSDFVTKLKKFGPHQLGILSRGGMQVFHTDTYKVSNYIIPDSTAYTTPLNAVWDAVKISDSLYAVTTASGFYLVSNTAVKYRYDAFSIKDIGRKQMLFGREIFPVTKEDYIVYTNEVDQRMFNARTKKFGPIDGKENLYDPFMQPNQYPGDRWLVKSQISNDEFIFVPLKTDSIIYYNSTRKLRVSSALPETYIRQIQWNSKCLPIGNGVLLINGGLTGFYKLHLNAQTGKIICDDNKYLPNYEIKCLYLDKDKRLWIGTTEGLLKQKLDPPSIASFEYEPNTPGTGKPFFTGVYRYKKYLYVTQYNRAGGLTLIDPANMRRVKDIRFFGQDEPWNEIFSIEMYHPDTLWLGTYAGVLWFDTRTEHYGKLLDFKHYPWAENFRAVLAPPRADGYAWICAYLGGRLIRYHIPTRSFTVFTPQSNPALPFDKVKSIAYDAYGDVWVGGHALSRWNNRLQTFDTTISVYAGANKFNEDMLTLSADTKGSLWFHNVDNGLLEYHIKEKQFTSYSLNDGLPTRAFGSFSAVINDQLWMAGNSQLCLLNIPTKQVTVYNYEDGFPAKASSSRNIYFDKTDSLFYLLAGNTIVKFHFVPEKKTGETNEILIEDITINNRSTRFQPGATIKLRYDENNLGLRFTIVDYDKNNYQYAYRLNHSPSWNFINAQHSISFNNLSPGNYELELAASGKPGVRKTKTITIIVEPPIWARTWFIALIALLSGTIITALFRMRLKLVRKQANIDKQLSKTEMKALQSQMNPHFVFNSLNSIREMILSEENKLASTYLARFAQLIRITLEQSTQETVSLRATIDYLQRYIEIEMIRNGLLKYEINVADEIDIDETEVSPMIIQPFVENAIWHGVSATRKDITVKISFAVSGNLLTCTIDDNGVGIAHSQATKKHGIHRKSHGINNIQNRIELLNEKYSQQSSVTIIDKKDIPGSIETGTVVTIQLPYQTNES